MCKISQKSTIYVEIITRIHEMKWDGKMYVGVCTKLIFIQKGCTIIVTTQYECNKADIGWTDRYISILSMSVKWMLNSIHTCFYAEVKKQKGIVNF